jgi:hypothetical protein
MLDVDRDPIGLLLSHLGKWDLRALAIACIEQYAMLPRLLVSAYVSHSEPPFVFIGYPHLIISYKG